MSFQIRKFGLDQISSPRSLLQSLASPRNGTNSLDLKSDQSSFSDLKYYVKSLTMMDRQFLLIHKHANHGIHVELL